MIYAKRSANSLTRTGVGRHRLCLACRQPSHLLRHHRRHLSATRQRLWSTLFVPDEMAAPGQLPPKRLQIPGMPVVMRCLQCLVVFSYQFVIFMLLFSSWVKKSLCRWQKCPCARVEYTLRWATSCTWCWCVAYFQHEWTGSTSLHFLISCLAEWCPGALVQCWISHSTSNVWNCSAVYCSPLSLIKVDGIPHRAKCIFSARITAVVVAAIECGLLLTPLTICPKSRNSRESMSNSRNSPAERIC